MGFQQLPGPLYPQKRGPSLILAVKPFEPVSHKIATIAPGLRIVPIQNYSITQTKLYKKLYIRDMSYAGYTTSFGIVAEKSNVCL